MYFPLKNAIYNTANIGIGIRSVSADLKKKISVIYRIGRFKKWDLSVYIGIGRYEKKLIGRTLVGQRLATLEKPKYVESIDKIGLMRHIPKKQPVFFKVN